MLLENFSHILDFLTIIHLHYGAALFPGRQLCELLEEGLRVRPRLAPELPVAAQGGAEPPGERALFTISNQLSDCWAISLSISAFVAACSASNSFALAVSP